jgi:NDP-sugar pyrophosphorylase family protein
VYGIAPEGYWMDIGRSEQYLAANTAVLTHAVRTVVPFRQIGDGAEIAEDVQIDSTTSIGKGAKIGSGTRLTGCILLDGVTVGAKATLNVVIADERAHIAEDVTARGGQVIASDSRIERGTRL